MGITVSKLSNVYIQEIVPDKFHIRVCDCKKRDIKEINYFSLGYFIRMKDGSTCPIGNLVDCGKIYSQSTDSPSWVGIHNKELSTLYIKNDGSFGITKMKHLENKGIKTAISGIPIIKNNEVVQDSEKRDEGYSLTNLNYTWHGFLCVRGNSIIYISSKCNYRNMSKILLSLGVSDGIKIDGGGSLILCNNGSIIKSTAGNRRINNIGIWE
jgi:hypothetical protein